MLISLIVVVILQYMCASKHCLVHLKYIWYLSLKKRRKKRKIWCCGPRCWLESQVSPWPFLLCCQVPGSQLPPQYLNVPLKPLPGCQEQASTNLEKRAAIWFSATPRGEEGSSPRWRRGMERVSTGPLWIQALGVRLESHFGLILQSGCYSVPKKACHLESENVVLFGSRVFVNVISKEEIILLLE